MVRRTLENAFDMAEKVAGNIRATFTEIFSPNGPRRTRSSYRAVRYNQKSTKKPLKGFMK